MLVVSSSTLNFTDTDASATGSSGKGIYAIDSVLNLNGGTLSGKAKGIWLSSSEGTLTNLTLSGSEEGLLSVGSSGLVLNGLNTSNSQRGIYLLNTNDVSMGNLTLSNHSS